MTREELAANILEDIAEFEQASGQRVKSIFLGNYYGPDRAVSIRCMLDDEPSMLKLKTIPFTEQQGEQEKE